MTAPRERGIIFSAPMVRAILEGRKMQTRRVLTPQPLYTPSSGLIWNGCAYGVTTDGRPFTGTIVKKCPHGRPGDRLWVRETFNIVHVSIDPETGYGDDVQAAPNIPKDDRGGWWSRVWRATDEQADYHRDDRGFAWRPGIHMPRWASRITLEIAEVRVQRLQEISDDDARVEGVDPYTPPTGHISPDQRVPGPGFENCRLGDQPHRLPFADLWDSINGKPRAMLDDDGNPVLDDNEQPIMVAPKSWASNPWVWAISFSRIA